MAWKAATEIQHGKQTSTESDPVEVTTFAEGDDVNQSDFSEDEWNSLVESGAVVDDSVEEEDLPINQSVTEVTGMGVPGPGESEEGSTSGAQPEAKSTQAKEAATKQAK